MKNQQKHPPNQRKSMKINTKQQINWYNYLNNNDFLINALAFPRALPKTHKKKKKMLKYYVLLACQ